jgi:hypothetical protein
LTFDQARKAGALDRADVNEYVLAAINGLDESKALLAVEPLHGSCDHLLVPLDIEKACVGFAPNGIAVRDFARRLQTSSRYI